jgi:hypothetical protein
MKSEGFTSNKWGRKSFYICQWQMSEPLRVTGLYKIFKEAEEERQRLIKETGRLFFINFQFVNEGGTG